MDNAENAKVGWLGLATIWFGGVISVPSLLIGSTLIAGLTFVEVLLAGCVGFTVVALFMSLESVAAVDQRRDTVSLASSSFGSSGARVVVGLALGVSLLGWFGVQSGIAGGSFARIANLSFGLRLSAAWCSFVLGLLMMLTAVFGFRYLKWLNFVAVPCKVLLVAYAVVVAFQSHSFDLILQHQPAADKRLDFMTAIGLSIGFFSVGGVVSPDYARHATTRSAAVLGSMLGLLPAAIGLAACGAMLAIIQQTYDVVEIYAKLGMPMLALSVLIVATWTTNVMNAYSSGLALNQLLHWPEQRRRLATVIAGVAGSALAAVGILDNFMSFLMLLTVTIPPIAGVLVSDYWVVRSYRSTGHALVHWEGVLAWGCGVGVMLLISHPIRNVLGIFVAGGAYWLAMRLRQGRVALR
jgi:cytosine permease